MKLGAIVVLFLTAILAAQAADSKLTFEAASVKPAGPFVPGEMGGMRGGPGTGDPGRITIARATLTNLLTRAYDVWFDQVSGPAWLNDGSAYAYRIDATLPPNTTMEQFRLMLQNLLAERFHLRLHHETKLRPGYELVVASGGPKLKEWNPATSAAPGKPGVDGNGFPTLPPGAPVGFVMRSGGGAAAIRMTHRETMAMFCRGLGNNINMSNGTPTGPQARVVDKTGLTGTYEFTLEFAGSVGMMPSAPAEGEPGTPLASDPTGGAPDIFTAVEKQLGLKLVKVKDIPVDILIVENADKVPTAN
ncbi:MAG: TIGR03435 family protein [Bryobacteraceae bacterium]